MNIKKTLINAINEHKEDIDNVLNDYDAYLFLTIYDDLNQQGNSWHSRSIDKYDDEDCTETIERYIVDDIFLHDDSSKLMDDWGTIKSWSIELWQNDEYGYEDKFITSFKGNILTSDLFVNMMCKVHNTAIDIRNGLTDKKSAENTLYEVAQTLAKIADQLD